MPALAHESLHYRSASELARSVRSGELSARELLEAHLARIDEVNPRFNAIVTQVPEMAMKWAREADERQARGEPLGPLHGLPIAHKDLLLTAGIRSTFGSNLLRDHVAKRGDLIVERLRRAGAICLGKTNVPTLTNGMTTDNSVYGLTRNAYDLERTCAGSSGRGASLHRPQTYVVPSGRAITSGLPMLPPSLSRSPNTPSRVPPPSSFHPPLSPFPSSLSFPLSLLPSLPPSPFPLSSFLPSFLPSFFLMSCSSRPPLL